MATDGGPSMQASNDSIGCRLRVRTLGSAFLPVLFVLALSLGCSSGSGSDSTGSPGGTSAVEAGGASSASELTPDDVPDDCFAPVSEVEAQMGMDLEGTTADRSSPPNGIVCNLREPSGRLNMIVSVTLPPDGAEVYASASGLVDDPVVDYTESEPLGADSYLWSTANGAESVSQIQVAVLDAGTDLSVILSGSEADATGLRSNVVAMVQSMQNRLHAVQ